MIEVKNAQAPPVVFLSHLHVNLVYRRPVHPNLFFNRWQGIRTTRQWKLCKLLPYGAPVPCMRTDLHVRMLHDGAHCRIPSVVGNPPCIRVDGDMLVIQDLQHLQRACVLERDVVPSEYW
jgi:hypothetical protein